MRKTILLLAVFASYFALGLPDGAFGVAWPVLRYEMELPLNMASVMVFSHSIFFAITSSQIERLTKFFSLPSLAVIGMIMLVIGMIGFALAPNFIILAVISMFLGIGMGMLESALNTVAVQQFNQRHMNWVHCFWGLGAATSPLIMTTMVTFAGWRTGYISIAVIQSMVLAIVAITVAKGIWLTKHTENSKDEFTHEAKIYLTSPYFQAIHVLMFILYMVGEYSITLWTTSVMYESRGLSFTVAGLFPSIYLGFLMGGRFVAGILKLSNITMIRVGVILSIIGMIILIFTNSFVGIALIGFGFAPVFPCLMHETSQRFNPEIITKLVGYQVAAAGIGAAGGSFVVGQILERVSREALFPVLIIPMVLFFILNERIESVLKKRNKEAIV